MKKVYIAFFNNKEENLEADSLLDAKKKAIALFKVRKSQEHRVSVHLAQVGGKDVIHVATS